MSIFYFCPWVAAPTGGTKQIHRHVEALSEAGFDAHVLVATRTDPGWFDTAAPVALLQKPLWRVLSDRLRRRVDDLRWLRTARGPLVQMRQPDGSTLQRRLTADDIVVLPEFYGKKLAGSAFGARVVIFNQNAHYTFRFFDHVESADFVYRTGAFAVLGVSDHIVDYLQFAFPGLDVLLTRNGIELARFHPPPSKKRQIAFMPRKVPMDIVQVLQILHSRGTLKNWTLRPIDNMTEVEVAEVMRESAFFLSTCQAEGFGLPPLEAAACACIVVGYCGEAAREFMLPQYCYPVDQGDVLGYAMTLERLLQEYERDPAPLTQRAHEHAQFVRGRYSREAEAASVVEAWTRLLRKEPQVSALRMGHHHGGHSLPGAAARPADEVSQRT